LLARGDAGMWRLEEGKWALLLGERGEAGKPTTAHTCTHEESLEREGVKGKQRDEERGWKDEGEEERRC
jgi:hypothetical protein